VGRRGLRATLWGPLALVLGCGAPDPAADEAIVVSVRCAPAGRETITSTASVDGTVHAKQEAVLSARLSGQLGGLGRLQNTEVRAGQTLATLDSVDWYAAQKDLREAQAAAANLDALATRRRALFAQGGLARRDLEETELALKTAQEDLGAAGRTLGAMSGGGQGGGAVGGGGGAAIRAPFAGVVVEQLQFDGEYVTEGTPILRLADLSEILVKARFPDTVGARLTMGGAATVSDEAVGGDPVTGEVTMISRTTDPVSRTQEVWVRVTDGADRLRVGDAARVTAATATADDAVVVPLQAVLLDTSTGDEGTVMVVDAQDVAHEVHVKVGIRTADRVQVVDGLVGGERVVVEGNYALPDGTKVAVAAAEPTEPAAAEPAEPAP